MAEKQEKQPKVRKESRSSLIDEMLKGGKTNDEIVKAVQTKFSDATDAKKVRTHISVRKNHLKGGSSKKASKK